MSYNLQYRPTGTMTWTLINTQATSVTLTDLLPATSYDCEVQAVDDSTGLTSAFTAIVSATTLPSSVSSASPSAFSIAPVSGAAVSTLITSSPVTLSGFSGAIAITVTGGQISVNGGGYTTSTTISVGQSFTVQVTSSSSNSTAATATVTAGGVSANFVVTTLAATV